MWRGHAHGVQLGQKRDASSISVALEGWREHTRHKQLLRRLHEGSREQRVQHERRQALLHWQYFATSNVRCRQTAHAAQHIYGFRIRACLQQWLRVRQRRALEVETLAALEELRASYAQRDLRGRLRFWDTDVKRAVRHRRCGDTLRQAQIGALLRTSMCLWTAALTEAAQKAVFAHRTMAQRKAFNRLAEHAAQGRWMTKAVAVASKQWRERMLSSFLNGWRDAIVMQHRLGALTQDVQRREVSGSLQACFGAWLTFRKMAKREVAAAVMAIRHLLRRILRLWQKEIQLDRACAVWRNNHLARGIIKLWRRACVARKTYRMLSSELRNHRRQVSLLYGLRRFHWCASQQRAVQHFMRQSHMARQVRLAFTALVAWQHCLSSSKRKKNNKVLSHRLWVNQALTWTFRTWRTFQIHRGWCSQVVTDTWTQRHLELLQSVIQAWLSLVTRRRRMVVLTHGVEGQRKQRWLQAWMKLFLRHGDITEFTTRRELSHIRLLLCAWQEAAAWTKSERREALLHWRCWMAWRKLERDAMHELAEGARCRELRRGLGCLVHNTWRSHEARRGRLAAEVWIFGARSSALSAWRSFAQQRSMRRSLNAEALSLGNTRCLRRCMQVWRLQGRFGRARKAVNACAGVLDAGVECLQAWRSYALASRHHYAEIQACIAARHSRRIVAVAFVSLQTHIQSQKARFSQAGMARTAIKRIQQRRGLRALVRKRKTSRCERISLQMWRVQMAQLEHAVFAAWRESVSRKVLAKRPGGMVLRCFGRWQHYAADRQQLDSRLEAFIASVLRHVLERTVRQWAGLLLFVKMAQKLCHAAAMRQVAPCWVAWAIRARAVRKYRGTEGRHPDVVEEEAPAVDVRSVRPEVDESLRAGFLAWVTHLKWRRSKLLATDLAAARVQHRQVSSARESLQHWRMFASGKRAKREDLSQEGASAIGEFVFTPPTAVQADLGEPAGKKQYSELRCEVDIAATPGYDPTPHFGAQQTLLMPIPESPSSGDTSRLSSSMEALTPLDATDPKAMENLLLSAGVYAQEVPADTIVSTGSLRSSEGECEVPDECSYHELPSHEAVVQVVAAESFLMRRSGPCWPTGEPTIVSLGEAEDGIPEEEHGTLPLSSVCSPRVGESSARRRAASESPGCKTDTSSGEGDIVSLL